MHTLLQTSFVFARNEEKLILSISEEKLSNVAKISRFLSICRGGGGGGHNDEISQVVPVEKYEKKRNFHILFGYP